MRLLDRMMENYTLFLTRKPVDFRLYGFRGQTLRHSARGKHLHLLEEWPIRCGKALINWANVCCNRLMRRQLPEQKKNLSRSIFLKYNMKTFYIGSSIFGKTEFVLLREST